jgi:hypothetical protein
MTDRPYTDNDLRAEAAAQYATALRDPDFMGIGEQMEDSTVPSTEDGDTGLTWHELLVPEGGGSYEAYGEAQRAIDDLLGKAADVSEWAIDIGAEGLEPLDSVLSMQTNTGPLVRIHFAVRPDMPDHMRRALVEGLGMEIAKFLPQTD